MNTVPKPAMGVQLATKCKCYTSAMAKPSQFIRKPTRIIVHSTGCNNPNLKRYVGPDDGVLGKNTAGNHWNREANTGKGANAFIGKAADGTPMIYQTLPWDMRPWLSGSGSKGNANHFAVQFEMCEDNLTNESYWRQVRAQAVHLCAWLCQEYGIPAANIWGHYEAHAYGYANNHADPRNWMKKFGDTMDLFRADVRAMLNGDATPGGVEDIAEGETDMTHYIGTVQTKKDGRISLWSDAKKTKRLCYINDGEQAEVLGENVTGTMAPATAKGFVGFVDTQYLINRQNVDVPQEIIDGDGSEVAFTGQGILLRADNLAVLLEALRNAIIIGTDDEDLAGE